jgi:hypothetical protein
MIRLPQHVADYLRKVGGGSLSRGIIQQTTGGPPDLRTFRTTPPKAKRVAKA